MYIVYISATAVIKFSLQGANSSFNEHLSADQLQSGEQLASQPLGQSIS